MSAAQHPDLPMTDAQTARLIEQLDELYAVQELPAVLRDPARVVMAAATRPARVSLPRWWSVRRALAAIAALVVLTGAGYAAVSFLPSTWQRDRALDRVFQRGLVTELQLAQTVDGVAVRLERAYADVNRIAIGVSVDAPGLGGQATIAPWSFALQDSAGHRFEAGTGHGYGAAGSPYGAMVVVFDATSLAGSSSPLDLRLTIDRVSGSDRGVAGPWEFHFTLPVHGARVATATAIVEGVNVDVRVVAAPSETRVVVHAVDAAGRPWKHGLRLVIGDESYRPAWGRCQRDGTCPLFVFMDSLSDREGGWAVVLEGFEAADGSGAVIPGVWVIPLTFE